MGASGVRAAGGYRVAGALVALLVAALGVVAPASTAGVPATPLIDTARAAVPDAVGPRIAFTAARDAVATVSVSFPESDEGTGVAATASSVPPITPAPVHEGELSSNAAGAQAFISTRDDPRGEVYVIMAPAGSQTGQAPPVRVTCNNTAAESHPVISPDGTRVAYATNASGVSRLRLLVLDPDGAACPSAGFDLGAPTGADTGPTWLSDRWLGFSSTSLDPLGDIWAQYVGPAAPPPQPAPSAIRLTTGVAAETQPASVDGYLEGPLQTVLMFTTTQYRTDGSIGAMTLPDLSAEGDTANLLKGGGTPVYSPWTGDRDDPPQGSEAALTLGYDGGINLAFSTNDGDPYGDIVAVIGNDDDFLGNEVALPLPFGLDDSHLDIADRPGRAETQPVWLPGPDFYSRRVSYTERTPSATVADVRAADGTGRRTIGGDITVPLDESTPAYSPDGTRLAYSRIGPGGQGREIVVSDAAGRAPVALTPTPTAPVFDSEPAWSPDGTRVAFIRSDLCSDSPPCAGSKLWIADVATRRARLVTVDPAGADAWDQHPSWSPDGTRVVIGRTLAAPPDLIASFASKSVTIENGASVVVELTVTNRGLGAARQVQVSLPPFQSGSLFTVDAPLDLSCSNYRTFTSQCVVATLPAGKSRTFKLTVTATPDGTGTDSLNISSSVLGTPPEIITGNNAASIAVNVVEVPPAPSPTFTTTDWYLPPREPGTGPQFAFAAWSPPQPVADTATPPALIRAVSAAVSAETVSAAAPMNVRPAGIREVFSAPPASDVSSLWVVDAVTGVAHQLATPAPKTCQCVRTIEGRSPAWSPDGMRIAYEERGSVRLLTLADPRGAAIAVTQEVPHVQMVTGFTGQYQREIGGAATVGAATPSRPTISAAQDPAWSPDGGWIVLTGQPAAGADNPGVYRLRATGSGLTVVAQRAGPETEPAWQPWAGLTVKLNASPASISLGSQATLTTTVTNRGPGIGADTVLAVTIPAGLTPGKLPAGCVSAATATGSLVTCTLGSLRPKAATPPATGPAPVTVTVLIPVIGAVLGPYAVTAAVGSASPDDLASDNEASTSITVIPALPPPPTIPTPPPTATDARVTVAVAPNPGYVGGSGTVTVVVSNGGKAPLVDATVTVTLPTITAPTTTAVTPTSTTTPTTTTPSPTTTTPSPTTTTPSPTTTTPSPTTTTPNTPSAATPVPPPPPGAVELVGTPECFTGAPCALGPIAPGSTRAFTATIEFATAGRSTITASVATGAVADSDPANNSSSVALVVRQPVVRLLQSVADPGSVVMAVGSDFPPGSQVSLSWDVGVNVRAAPLTVAADGTIRGAQVLIFRRDQLGARNLVATATKTGLFSPVQDAMMVAPRTVAPPADFASRS